MANKELLKDYLTKLQDALEKDNFEALDEILEFIVSGNMSESDIKAIDDILSEATLYMELKEADYKEEALRLISEYK